MSASVLYMGYGQVGLACLQNLLAAAFDVVGVFCRASDRCELVDDGGSVFTFARHRGLHCFAATDPSEPAFLAEATALRPDLLLSVQYDRILKPALLAIPTHGAYNLHFGPLPRLRGCFPTKWAIIEDEPAGVTFHCIDPGVDSGDIVDQEVVPLRPGETDETLYHRLQAVGHEVFRRQLGWMARLDRPPRQPQEAARSSYHPKRQPFDGIIDWGRDATWVDRFVRAFTFPPHPAAKTRLGDSVFEVLAPVSIGPSMPGARPGELTLAEGSRVAVACGDGSLLLDRVRLNGEVTTAGAALSDAAARREQLISP
jgi:methionyl-tRNA formyltransferase